MSFQNLSTLDNTKQWLQMSGLPISAITNSNPAMVTLATAPQYALVTGMTLGFQGVNGMNGLNGNQFVITVATPNVFSIPFDSTGAGTYTGGGLAGVSDQLLSRLLSSASYFIQNYITRTISLQTYDEVRNGLGTPVMTLKNSPVNSVGSVMVNGVTIQPRPPLNTVSFTSFGWGAGYTFDDTRVYLTGATFCRGVQNVEIIYTAGYATVPYDIEQACLFIIGDWFKYQSRIGKLSEGIEGQTITFTHDEISPRALAILDVYHQRAPIY